MTPLLDSLAQTYLTSRGLDCVRLAGYLENLRFMAACPLHAWKPGQRPESVPTAPAMVAPIHRVTRAPGNIDQRFMGVHVTYLHADGLGKLARTGADGNPLADRKIFGAHRGGAVLLTSMEAKWPLLNGEGIESTLAGLSIMLRALPMFRVAASLSLNNHQGCPMLTGDGAIPLKDIRYDPARFGFGFESPGQVYSLTDGDMKSMAHLRVDRGDGLALGITTAERTRLCSDLLDSKWRGLGASWHHALEPGDGLDHNDLWRLMGTGDECQR